MEVAMFGFCDTETTALAFLLMQGALKGYP